MWRGAVLAVLLCLAAPVLAADALPKADAVLIKKSKRELILLNHGRVLKTYKVSLGFHPKGPKRKQGDGKTPEGHYVIDKRNEKSQFHRSLHISYPNEQDIARAKRQHVNPGGDIFIHGLPNGYKKIGKLHLLHDWTAGCIAVTDEEIDEIWNRVPDGTPVDIKP